MTLMIILGGFAALYMIALLFRLAVHALPIYVGVGAALFLHGQGYGLPAAIVAGFIAGLAAYLAGRVLHASIRSPLLRLLLAVIFATPAGFAGYQAVAGLAGLLIDDGGWIRGLAIAGGLATATTAWRSLVGSRNSADRETRPDVNTILPLAP
ncbi:MAG: hypothetical protein ACREBX_13540 [Sphingopyxis sp.]